MQFLIKVWNMLGQVMGEGEYLRYCKHMQARHPELKLMTDREFYVSRLNEKYSRPNKCC